MLNYETETVGQLEIFDNESYHLNDSQNAVYKINTLGSIGWNDPFPKNLPQIKDGAPKGKDKVEKSKSKLTKHIQIFDDIGAQTSEYQQNDLAYNKCILDKPYSPAVLFIPTT